MFCHYFFKKSVDHILLNTNILDIYARRLPITKNGYNLEQLPFSAYTKSGPIQDLKNNIPILRNYQQRRKKKYFKNIPTEKGPVCSPLNITKKLTEPDLLYKICGDPIRLRGRPYRIFLLASIIISIGHLTPYFMYVYGGIIDYLIGL